MCKQRNIELPNITKELQKMKTAPSMKEAILEGLKCVINETEYDLHEDSHLLLFSEAHLYMLEKQKRIGWEYFLKGFVVKEWGY
jgi:hypothetical protein